MSELKEGMIFKNAREMCNFIGIDYESELPPQIYKRLAGYCNYHRTDKKDIVVDNVFDVPDFSKCDNRNNDHIYEIGDVFNNSNGTIEVIEKIRYGEKNRKSYVCKCSTCGQEFIQYEYNLKKGIGCPVCHNKKVAIGINDMWTTNKELAEMLLNPDDGFKYTQSSSGSVDWECPICGEVIKNKMISNVNKRGLSCPFCSKTKSFPNRFMYNLLKYLKIDFEDEKVFEWSKFDDTFRRYDFYIPEYGIIEMMGRQHYHHTNFHTLSGRTLQDDIDNDTYKKQLATSNGIQNYACIDCQISDAEYIKNSLLNSNFGSTYDLSKVDWNYIDEQSQLNCLSVICDIWNSGEYDIMIISEKVGLGRGAVTKYLKKGNDLNLINYDIKKTKAAGNLKALAKMYQNRSNPIKCNENGLYFGSLFLCESVMSEIYNLKFLHSCIIQVLSGKNAKHKGFTFQYITREEFNRIKTESPELAHGDFFIPNYQSKTA